MSFMKKKNFSDNKVKHFAKKREKFQPTFNKRKPTWQHIDEELKDILPKYELVFLIKFNEILKKISNSWNELIKDWAK